MIEAKRVVERALVVEGRSGEGEARLVILVEFNLGERELRGGANE